MRFRRRRDGQKERGASLIEAAFVTPVFMLLIFGVFEFGFLFRNYLTLANATTEGARTASVAGRNADADFLVLQAVNHGISAWGLDDMEYIVIFKATDPSAAVPAGCVGPSGVSQPGVCNRYTPFHFSENYLDALAAPTENWGCYTSGAATAPEIAGSQDSHDLDWCPQDRNAALSDPPDYIGVHIAMTHSYMTGFIGDEIELTNTKIIRIEPERH
ncbi:MAG: hypothetical protein ACI8TP_003351 [Acidimicrobiales bacterium]|jgi:hypothetical protein